MIHQLWKAKRFTQGALARRLGISKSYAHKIVMGKSPTTLEVIEAVAGLTGIPAVELICQGGNIRVLERPELILIDQFRKWPPITQQALILFINVFGELEPEKADERRALVQLQHLPEKARQHAIGYLLQMHETRWTADLLEAFGTPQETANPEAANQSRQSARPRRGVRSQLSRHRRTW